MQEKINKRRIYLLIALLAVTAVVYGWIRAKSSDAGVPSDVFAIEDLDRVSKVTLESDTATVVLHFNGAYWRVNDRYDADGDMIQVLFATLQQARPRRAVPRADNDSLYRALTEKGVKVSLYTEAGLVKAFYAGGNATQTQAWFGEPDTGRVYVMGIPGYRVYVSGILELPAPAWRNKLVFGFNWRNFKALEAEFPGNEGDDFRISMAQRTFTVEGLHAVDTARLHQFLDDVSLLTVDAWRPEPRLRDSLQHLQADMEVRVSDVAGRVHRLRLYANEEGQEVAGLVGEGQPAVFDHRKIAPLLKPKSFFRKK